MHKQESSHISASWLITVDAAAELLAVSPSTVRRLIARRELQTVRIGRSVRIRLTDLADVAELRGELSEIRSGRHGS